MKKYFVLKIAYLLFFSSGIILSQQDNTKLRIGIFDSRCIALVYGRSAEFMKLSDSIDAVYSKAKEEGNKRKN